jgi:regulator of RNase E activity RraB
MLRVIDSDGLAVENEIEALADVEERCINTLVARLDAVYVGRIECDSVCTMTFYIPNGLGLGSALREALSITPGWQWQHEVMSDPQWAFYRVELYPDARRYRSLLNQITIDNLELYGDEIHQVRPVQHFIEFADAAARKLFLERVNRLGYKLVSTRDDVGGARPFTVAVSREHSCDPRAVDAVVYELLDLARPLGGEYDGWESQVICSGDDTLGDDEDSQDDPHDERSDDPPAGPRLAR